MRIPRPCYIFTVPGLPLARRLLVQPPPEWPEHPEPAAVLSFLDGGRKWRRSPREAERELKRRIEMAARLLQWPQLILATPAHLEGFPTVADPLVWCVAASKKTGNIILLGREPNLERLYDIEPILLHFPERRAVE